MDRVFVAFLYILEGGGTEYGVIFNRCNEAERISLKKVFRYLKGLEHIVSGGCHSKLGDALKICSWNKNFSFLSN